MFWGSFLEKGKPPGCMDGTRICPRPAGCTRIGAGGPRIASEHRRLSRMASSIQRTSRPDAKRAVHQDKDRNRGPPGPHKDPDRERRRAARAPTQRAPGHVLQQLQLSSFKFWVLRSLSEGHKRLLTKKSRYPFVRYFGTPALGQDQKFSTASCLGPGAQKIKRLGRADVSRLQYGG